MTDNEKDLIMQLTLGSIDQGSFLKKFGKGLESIPYYIHENLKNALILEDADFVEYGLLLGFNFSFPEKQDFINVLSSLLLQEWHYKHEDIARILQKLKSPESVDSLYQAVNTDYEYLEYNNCEALIVKCAYALGDINTEEAREKLRLMSESDNEIIQEAGKKQLERIGSG
ncbi:MAG: hypothetical protein JXR03_20840 [Cyclobacteriaceae bacterium]